jgi:hypothetical protein
MVFIFEVSSTENPDFKRLIHMGAEHSFEDLHQILQKTSGFDQSQLASFYLTDNRGKKLIEIGSLDSDQQASKLLYMRKTKLNDHITSDRQKFIYVFDYFNERLFYLELKEKIMKTDLKEPFVAYENGKAPAQFLISDFDNPEVDLMELNDTYKSFGELEDYYEIFGEMDA